MVKAREVASMGEADEAARFYGQPGDMVRSFRHNAQGLTWGFLVACPACGQFGGLPIFPIDGVKWDVVEGTVDDVTTLTLSPSILKKCCGWHGYLKKGVFEPC